MPTPRIILTFVGLLLASVVSPFFGKANPIQEKKTEEQQPTFRAEVQMVSLQVVVSTREGRRITNLKQEDFRIYEDGLEQTIAGFRGTDEPVSIALTIDTSGSTQVQLARMQNAAIDFCTALHPDDSVAVISFADEVLLQGKFSIDPNQNAYAIKKTRPGGCTAIYEAVYLSLEDILKPVQERKALVLFSDGVDTCSHKTSEKETLELAKESYATIYSVYYNTERDPVNQYRRPSIGGIPGQGYPPMGVPGGIGTNTGEYMQGRNYLKKLAEYSGGLVLDALKLQDLSSAFDQIAKELSSQYSIGYYPSNQTHDGKYRKIQVKMNKPDLVARTRTGYYAPKDKKR
jgi:Ca-activated chloride channel homolog